MFLLPTRKPQILSTYLSRITSRMIVWVWERRLRFTVGFLALVGLGLVAAVISNQSDNFNPNSIRTNLQKSGDVRLLHLWEASFRACVSEKLESNSRGCSWMDVQRASSNIHFPGNDLVKSLLGKDHHAKKIRVSLTYRLNQEEISWVESKSKVFLVMPNSVQLASHLVEPVGKNFATSSSYGFDVDGIFPIDIRELLMMQDPVIRMQIESETRGWQWFGPTALPPALVVGGAVAEYSGVFDRWRVSDLLRQRLDVSIPLVVAGMTLVLDHSKPLVNLGYLSALRGLRSLLFYFFQNEPDSVFVQVGVVFLNPLIVLATWLFVLSLFKIKLSRKTRAYVLGVLILMQGLNSAFDPSLLTSDLWADVLSCLGGIVVALWLSFGWYSRRKKAQVGHQAHLKTKPGKRLGILPLGIILVTFSLGFSSNLQDLVSISESQLKNFLALGHFVLIPGLLVAALFETEFVASAIKRMELEVASQAKIDLDLELSGQLQKSLLPMRKGTNEGWSWRVMHHPASQLSGDWFDVRNIQTSNGKQLLVGCVADATGHGIPAALIISSIASEWKSWIGSVDKKIPDLTKIKEYSLRTATQNIHQRLVLGGYELGATVAIFVFDPLSRELNFLTAGHPGLIGAGDSSFHYYVSKGSRVGYGGDGSNFEAKTIIIPSGVSEIFVYSDGLIPPEVPLSRWLNRLKKSVISKGLQRSGVLAELVNQLKMSRKHFRRFPEVEDDLTLLVLRQTKKTAEQSRSA